jgi:CspA family cold shock protein
LADSTTVEGAVKWFSPEKGFGFVVADDGGKDVFVHISVLERAGTRELSEGQRVSMQVVQTQKGREALTLALA